MRLIGTIIAAAAISVVSQSAEARGCIKGAFVGGVAGHYAGHHGLLGAVAGCAVGRHEAKKQRSMAPETDGRGGGYRRDQRDRL